MLFNKTTYILWFLLGCYHAAVVYFVPIYSFLDSGIMWGDYEDNGKIGDLWIMSLSSFTSIIIVVNLKLLLGSRSLSLVHFVAIIITSIGLYITWMWLSDALI